MFEMCDALWAVWLTLVSTGGVYHDPEYYEDPEVFNPDRFLKTPCGTKPGVDDSAFRNDFVFGAGRVCHEVIVYDCMLTCLPF